MARVAAISAGVMTVVVNHGHAALLAFEFKAPSHAAKTVQALGAFFKADVHFHSRANGGQSVEHIVAARLRQADLTKLDAIAPHLKVVAHAAFKRHGSATRCLPQSRR